VVPKRAVAPIGAAKQTQKRNRKSCVALIPESSSAKELKLYKDNSFTLRKWVAGMGLVFALVFLDGLLSYWGW
jgi:hypothetical protein